MEIPIRCAHDEVIPLGDLKPNPRNPNKHPAEQIALLAKIIFSQGWRNPIVVSNRSGLITKGHARLEAARIIGADRAPVDRQDYGSEQEELADMIADNRIAELAEPDRGMLRELMEQLDTGDFDMDLTGFDNLALEELMTAAPPEEVDAEPQMERGAELRDKWGVELGQVWQLGAHRLMCGDCRKESDVARLLEENKINLAFTSPPYAEQRDYDRQSGFNPIHPDNYVEWFAPVSANIARFLTDDGSFFLNIKPTADGLDTQLYVFDLVLAHARDWGWHFATEFCWERVGVPRQVTGRFKNQFEPIYQFARNKWKMRPDSVRHASDKVPFNSDVHDWSSKLQGKGHGFFKKFKRIESGQFWYVPTEDGGHRKEVIGGYVGEGLAYPGNRLPAFQNEALGHPATFPVRLPMFFLEAYTDKHDKVYDPFLGSGSTIIAAENTNRTGFGMELSPLYTAIAIQRFVDATNKNATIAPSNCV